jgi:citrate lyase subunit beta/citryl-CoA lyase
MEIMRSLMFVPGHRERMVEKALGLSLDVAFLDLEDGAPPGEKDNARAMVARALGRPSGGPLRFVRVNAIGTDRLEADLRAVVRPGLQGLVLPKVERPEEVLTVDAILNEREPSAGLERGSVKFIPSVESARGLLNAPAIAACCERVVGIMFGAEDFGLDLGLPTNREGEARELIYARSAMVVAAASVHVQAIDGVWPDIHDGEGLRRDALQARRLGFSGKSLIHPGQIDTINEIFSPTPGEVDYARRVVQAFEEAEARGEGAIAFGGQLIDLPIVERARRLLRLHAAIGRLE